MGKADDYKNKYKNELKKYDYPGIYSISVGDKIVYIGKAANMKDRIVSHCIKIDYYNQVKEATGKKYEMLHLSKQDGEDVKFNVLQKVGYSKNMDLELGYLEALYIHIYKPILNTQIPYLVNFHRWKKNKNLKDLTYKDFLKKVRTI